MNSPVLKWNAEEEDFYLMCLVGPDAPSRDDPNLKNFLHWMVGNIPGSNLDMGETLAEYVGAVPPKDTGLHRHVFLLYKQPNKLDFQEEMRITLSEFDPRTNFSVHNFVEKYYLGNPISGNMFQAQYDDYVPVLQNQLNIAM